MNNKIEICPDCGCIIVEELNENSCWCGVSIKATEPQRETAKAMEEKDEESISGNNRNRTRRG